MATYSKSLSTTLQRAIDLRMKVRDALDREDIGAIPDLNSAADKAYLDLDAFEAAQYIEWARSDDDAEVN